MKRVRVCIVFLKKVIFINKYSKDVLAKKLIYLIKYYDVGRTSVVGRVTGTVSVVLSVFTFLKVYNIAFSKIQMIFLGGLVAFFMLISGYIYVKLGLYEKEIDFSINQNKAFRKILEEKKK